MNPLFAWLGKRLFGFAATTADDQLDDAARTARDYLAQLQEQARPVPLPYAAVRHQQQQIASATTHPPTCPPSGAPSRPPSTPPVSMSIDRGRYEYVAPPETPRPLPQPQRPFSRSSSGPPPRMSPPPELPPPPRLPLDLRTHPTVPSPPRPKKR